MEEGNSTQGLDGQVAPWADNFFNITDLGVCNVCAKTPEQAQAALIAYIGNAPPAPLSYTSKNVRADALAKAVFFYRRGEIMDHTWEQQYNSASGLNLVVAAIILWNTVYLAKAIAYLGQQGEAIPDEYLKHLSPVAWEHISLTGDYIWNLRQETILDDLRPLRAS